MSNTRVWLRMAATLVLLWNVSSAALGEIIYKIPTGFGYRMGVPLHLLELEAVQKDLALGADTAYRLSQWKSSVEASIQPKAVAIKEKAKRRELLKGLPGTFQTELDGILSADQQNRLHEIDLQMEGIEALSDPAVANAIGLSPAQQGQILAIHKRILQEEKASIKGGPRPNHLSTDARNKLIVDVLSPDQQEKFSLIKGLPFDTSGYLQTLRLRDKEMEIWNVAFSPDGKRLASSKENSITIWDAESGKLVSRIKGHSANITSMCFGPDSKWIISASTDRTVKSWDVESGDNILSHGEAHSGFQGRFIPGLGAECFRSMALSPDGKRLAHANGTNVSISNDINPLVAPFFKASESYYGIADRLPVWSVAYCSDGKRQACGRVDGSVLFLGFGAPRKITAATDAVLCVAFSPDGQQIATASVDGSVKLWDAMNGSEVASLQAHEKAVRCVAFSADGSQVASAGDDGVVKVSARDKPSEPIVSLKHPNQATGVSFCLDGKRLVTAGSDGLVRIWSISGEELHVLTPLGNN